MSDERFRWIPPKERMPTHTDTVIVRLSNGMESKAVYDGLTSLWSILSYKKITGKISGWIEESDYDAWRECLNE